MRLRRDYVAWCLNQADQWLTPSVYMASAYADAGFPSAPVTVLSNGIDIDSIPFAPKHSPPDPAVKFLYSGYLGEHKGILVLLDALRQLQQDVNLSLRWQMTIAGDGHLRKTVETTLERYKLAENVRLIGRVSRAKLLQLLSEADVAVLPSIWPENQPVSLLEAIASGTPQIATRIGGNPELVEHMRTGLLVKPGDAADLVEAMRRYILEPSLLTQHGTNSRQRRQQWDEARTIDTLESILGAASPAPGSTQTVEPVIVCHGESAPPEAGLLINRAYQHLPGPPTPRFLWYRWVEPAVWQDAVAVWLWDRDGDESVFQAALRRGIPVLSPDTDWAQGLSRHYGGVRLYHTFTEALAILRVLLARPALRAELAERAQASATAATFFASPQAFTLHSEAPVEPN